MSPTVPIRIVDRLDRKFSLEAEIGSLFRSFLLTNYIPESAVILRVNGQITDDHNYVISDQDDIKLDLVRAYQLPEYCKMVGVWNQCETSDSYKPTKSSVYTAKHLMFQDNGIASLHKSHLNNSDFIKWLETNFVQGIVEKELIKEGDKICLALSGGRDSLALLYLLGRTRNKLPNFNLTAVTVAPSAARDEDVGIAAEAVGKFNIDRYTILDKNYVNETFNLSNKFDSAIQRVLQSQGRGWSISVWHSVMRANVERHCRENDISKIAFGYQHEDLMASLFRSIFNGLSFGISAPRKIWGHFVLISPLWTITKKELTIYLSLIAPKAHSSQGSPTDFDRGDHNRDINYFLSDMVSSIHPGAGFTLFEGYERFNANQDTSQNEVHVCRNCGIQYSDFSMQEVITNNVYCNTCILLMELGEINKVRVL